MKCTTNEKGHKLYISLSPINSRHNLISALHNGAILFASVRERESERDCILVRVRVRVLVGVTNLIRLYNFFPVSLGHHSTIYHLMEFISSQHVFRLLFVILFAESIKKSGTVQIIILATATTATFAAKWRRNQRALFKIDWWITIDPWLLIVAASFWEGGIFLLFTSQFGFSTLHVYSIHACEWVWSCFFPHPHPNLIYSLSRLNGLRSTCRKHIKSITCTNHCSMGVVHRQYRSGSIRSCSCWFFMTSRAILYAVRWWKCIDSFKFMFIILYYLYLYFKQKNLSNIAT